MSQAATYVRAMIDGNHDMLMRIEQKHDLFGYPPEIVSIGLRAIDEGKDAHEAIALYIAGEQT